MNEIKVVGKINKNQKSRDQYWVKRKNRTNSLDVKIMKEFGSQSREDCEKTCNLLNDSKDNFFTKNMGWRKSLEKKYYYFPTLYRQRKQKIHSGGESLDYEITSETYLRTK